MKTQNLKKNKISIYLDTNFIRDVLEKRNVNSITLIEAFRDLVSKSKINCFCSTFLLMELCDNKKDDLFFNECIKNKWEYKKIIRERGSAGLKNHHFEEVESYVKVFLKTYPFIEPSALAKNDQWDLAVDISVNSNIWAPDAIHLATALSNHCSYLITSDNHFKIEANKLMKENKINLKVIDTDEARKVFNL